MSTPEFPTMPVSATWVPRGAFGSFWHLASVTACPLCGGKHQHGGRGGPEPEYGSRLAHCAGDHKGFRDDCVVVRNVGGQRRCKVRHGEVCELVPASDLEVELASNRSPRAHKVGADKAGAT
jgi:hypothetical protein